MKMRQVLFLFLILSSTLGAETILLQNGGIVRGKISNQDRVSVTIETTQGRQVIQKAAIRRIVYDDAKFEEEEKRRLEQERLRLEAERKRQEEQRRADEKKGEELRRSEELKRQQEIKRLEELKRQEESRREAKAREDAKNTPTAPAEPSIERTGFLLSGAGSKNSYKSGTFGYYFNERFNLLSPFGYPVAPYGVRERNYDAFTYSTGYQGRRWYLLLDGMQLRGHSSMQQSGAGFGQSSNALAPETSMGSGQIDLLRDSADFRFAFHPVPIRLPVRPYVYAGYSGSRIQSRFEVGDLISKPNNVQPQYFPGLRGTIVAHGPEAGIDLRYVRENGFEVRGLFGQAWQKGKFEQKAWLAIFNLNPSSIFDLIPNRLTEKGSAQLSINRYEATVYSPRFGIARLFAGYKEEQVSVHISQVLATYVPVELVALLTDRLSIFYPDILNKSGLSKSEDRFRGYRVGIELVF
ncbi:MAG: hypothetical protein K8S54_14975 [Spirochaetia bacterium]|nr:hypothetical protein [Spirochaetia bacterium]